MLSIVVTGVSSGLGAAFADAARRILSRVRDGDFENGSVLDLGSIG